MLSEFSSSGISVWGVVFKYMFLGSVVSTRIICPALYWWPRGRAFAPCIGGPGVKTILSRVKPKISVLVIETPWSSAEHIKDTSMQKLFDPMAE